VIVSSSSSVLLVGGSGFIGRALAASFAAEGREVHVLSRRPTLDLPAGVQTHVGDQGDKTVLRPLLTRCAQVIHLASETTPGDTVWSPSTEAEASLLPALRFLECLQDFPKSRVIFVSTGGALYGNADVANETTVPAPSSYHGAGKVALEAFFSVLSQRRSGGLTILRPSNIYGPGQHQRAGFGIIRNLLERAKDGGQVTLWGDGSSIRDYLYIDDMVMACKLALLGPAGIFNIGAGVGTSLNELIAHVQMITGRRLLVQRQAARASDVRQIVLDASRAMECLGWHPKASLADGILATWNWLVDEKHA
jgi:UDP-glucose 4-epimerase